MTPLILTTNQGLEDLVVQELGGEVVPLPTWRAGEVALRTDADWERLHGLRSVHLAQRLLLEEDLDQRPTLDTVRGLAHRVPVDALAGRPTFRVQVRRRGERFASSQEIARVAGGVLVRRTKAPVRLKGFQVSLNLEIEDDRARFLLQRSPDLLSKRFERPYTQRVSLRANVAWALLQLARPPAGGVLADPFCGSGTVLLEAAATRPDLTLLGSDWNRFAAEGTRANLLANGAQGLIVEQDARALGWDDGAVDAVVSNPPFGLKVGEGMAFFPFYAAVLSELHRVLKPAGRAVLLVRERGRFNGALREHGGFHIRHVRMLEMGGAWPGIFVLEKRT